MLTQIEFFALAELACKNRCIDILMWLIEAEVLTGRAHTTQDMFLLTHLGVTRGYVFVLEWLEQYCLLQQSDTLILRAIEHNQLESLQFLLSHGVRSTMATLSYAFRQAGERDDWWVQAGERDDWRVHDCLVKWFS
jgi:hypothetical protein